MPIGSSGRVVIEVEPELKLALHEALRKSGSNLKEWFIEQAELFLGNDQTQLEISFENGRANRQSSNRP
jgi:hypothetical protein